jgi:hypothetical protein
MAAIVAVPCVMACYFYVARSVRMFLKKWTPLWFQLFQGTRKFVLRDPRRPTLFEGQASDLACHATALGCA